MISACEAQHIAEAASKVHRIIEDAAAREAYEARIPVGLLHDAVRRSLNERGFMIHPTPQSPSAPVSTQQEDVVTWSPQEAVAAAAGMNWPQRNGLAGAGAILGAGLMPAATAGRG